MKVIIAEGGSANNIGSMALIENAIRIVKKKHPGCHITVFCLDKESVRKTLVIDSLIDGVEVINDLFPTPKGDSIKKFFWMLQVFGWIVYSRVLLLFFTNISWAFCGRRKMNLQEVEAAEYIYCIGAERINDIYYKTALLSLYAIGTYVKMGKKLVHMSLTIGPVFYRSTISVAKKVLNNSYAIFVRDQKSYDILKEWKCKVPCQFDSYDIALLQNTNMKLLNSLLNEFELTSGFVGVSVIPWKFRKAKGPVRQEGYEKAIAETLDYIVEKYNKQIVFTPTVVNGHIDDVEIGNRILSKMKNKEKAYCIQRLLTPIEMATLFSACQFSIVTRMHAAILCSGAGGRPIIAVNYLYKLREYMKNIGFENYSIDIDYVNSDDLKIFVDLMCNKYDENLRRLLDRQENLKTILLNDIEQI